jgi:hypothetical protein
VQPAALRKLAKVKPLGATWEASMPGRSPTASSGMPFRAYPARREVQETTSRAGIPSNTAHAVEVDERVAKDGVVREAGGGEVRVDGPGVVEALGLGARGDEGGVEAVGRRELAGVQAGEGAEDR